MGSAVGAFSTSRHFKELDEPIEIQEGVISPDQRKAKARANLGISSDPDGVAAAVAAAAALTGFTDNSGGTVSHTLAAVTAGGSYAQADIVALKNAVASLAAQLNAIKTALAS